MLPVIIFVIKFIALTVFKIIRGKYGQQTLKTARKWEKLNLRKEKIKCDLKFLLQCKRENVIPKFAQPKLSIYASYRVKRKIARTIIEAAITNKHNERKRIKRDLVETCRTLKEELGMVTFKSLKCRIRNVVQTKKKLWVLTHKKKMENIQRKSKEAQGIVTGDGIAKKVVHNFSSRPLLEEELEALAYGIDHYIPVKADAKRVEVEFEFYYENMLEEVTKLPEREKMNLKTNLLNACKNYTQVKVPYKYRKVVKSLSENESICLLKQDKGRGIVVVDRKDYIEKCEEMLKNKQFVQLREDPTEKFEGKVQRVLRDLKSKKRFTEEEYSKIYPSSSRPGRFYATAKRHKVSEDCTDAKELPLRPIVTNIGTATYGISKYLAKLLKPLSVSEYTINSTNDFVDKIKNEKVPQGYRLVSFDVASLFTNVPLDYTIKVILRKIYTNKLIKTKLKRHEMKELLEICTKELHFSFNGNMYKQVDGVVMGNPLGPVIANIFMVELENRQVPKMSSMVKKWQRYVDDTIAFVKEDKVNNVLRILNSYHKDIKFTYEEEENGELPFLDVLLKRKDDNSLNLKVYRKKTCTNIYIHWDSFAPKQWKTGTLEGMFKRAYAVCSEEVYLKEETEFLKKVFKDVNGYPTKIIDKCHNKVRMKMMTPENNQEETRTEDEEDRKRPYVILPYMGEKGEKILKAMKRRIPEKIRPRTVYQGTKLSAFFSTKDKVDPMHCSNLVYYYKGSGTGEKDDYTGETKCRIGKRIHEHIRYDTESAIYKNYHQKNITPPTPSDFSVIGKNYENRLKRRIAESLFIKEKKSSLNIQKDSHQLRLFK